MATSIFVVVISVDGSEGRGTDVKGTRAQVTRLRSGLCHGFGGVGVMAGLVGELVVYRQIDHRSWSSGLERLCLSSRKVLCGCNTACSN